MMYEPADNTLNLVAGNSLSETYRQAMQGITVEPEKGACGTAASTLKLVACDDIASDPRWDGFKELAAAEGLAACWSAPLVDSSGNMPNRALFDAYLSALASGPAATGNG